MILLIDNYDSFTYNLFQYFSKYKEVVTKRNDEISLEEINKLNPDYIVISPGPKRPEDAGICLEIIKEFYKKIPILGVCLGHQCIGKAFGGNITYAKEIFHGKKSLIKHNSKGIFKEVDEKFEVARYHSLVIDKTKVPKELNVTSKTLDGEIMSVRHKDYPLFGVQFHPESINTKGGIKIIENFLKEGKNVC